MTSCSNQDTYTEYIGYDFTQTILVVMSSITIRDITTVCMYATRNIIIKHQFGVTDLGTQANYRNKILVEQRITKCQYSKKQIIRSRFITATASWSKFRKKHGEFDTFIPGHLPEEDQETSFTSYIHIKPSRCLNIFSIDRLHSLPVQANRATSPIGCHSFVQHINMN